MRSLSLAVLLFSGIAQAQDLRNYEKVLFPVFTHKRVIGAGGVEFRTGASAYVRTPVAYWPAAVFGVEQEAPLVLTLPVGRSPLLLHDPLPRTAGRLVYFERPAVDSVSFTYGLFARGPEAEHSATLPVVRERDFLRGPFVLGGLSTQPIYDFSAGSPPETVGFRTRNHLRIYDPDHTGRLRVKISVRVDPLSAYGPFQEYDVAVDRRDGDDPSYPMYAEVYLRDLCITAPRGATCRVFSLDIHLEPNDPEARYYVVGSASDNITGQTSVFFPQ